IKNHGFDLKNLPKLSVHDDDLVPGSRVATNTHLSEVAYDRRWAHTPKVFITEVDASDSAISDPGFAYFMGCRHLESLKMNFCDYFGDDAIRFLATGRPAHTLKNLEIVLNPAVTDGMVFWISHLKALRRAHFYFLPYVSHRAAVLRQLKLALPKCHITFPEVDRIGLGYEN
ncbi:hypothetical protein AB6A40_010143, partial [Gnathostoma spinigerum]